MGGSLVASNVFGIQPHQLDATWPRVLPLIAEACKRGGDCHSPDDTLEALRAGRMQLWVAVSSEALDAVFVTRIVKHPGRTVAEVVIATGSGYQDWYAQFLETVEAWARANGADRVRLVARPGWQRVVKHFGYEPLHVELVKDL